MYYQWRCTSCGMKVEIERPVRDSGLAPTVPCPDCETKSWSKTMALTAPPVNYQRRDSAFPMRIPWGNGQFLEFKSREHQKQVLKEKGLVLHFDLSGRDITTGKDYSERERSVPPPSERAVRLANSAKFLSHQELSAITGPTVFLKE